MSREYKAVRTNEQRRGSQWDISSMALKLLGVATGMLFLYYLSKFLYIVFRRLGFPYDIEWLESEMINHVVQILEGNPWLYERPHAEFVATIYSPLYYYVGALLSPITGLGHAPLRAVSTLATCGTVVLLVLLVSGRHRYWLHGVAAAGLYLATYETSDFWFDLARVDSLFILWLLLGAYLYNKREVSGLWSAVALFLGFCTKQTGVAFALVFLAVMSLHDWRRSLLTGSTLVGLCGAFTGMFHLMTDGWSTYYLFLSPGGHRILEWKIVHFFRGDLLEVPLMAVVVGAAVVAAPFVYRRIRAEPTYLAALGLLLAAVPTGMLPRIKEGGHANNLMVVHVAGAVLTGAVLNWIAHEVRGTRLLRPLRILTLGGVLWQLVALDYEVAPRIPTAEMKRNGDNLVAFLTRAEGKVLLTGNGFMAYRAGRGRHAGGMAITDVRLSGNREIVEGMERELAAADYDVIIEHEGCAGYQKPNRRYTLLMEIPEDRSLKMLSGCPSSPRRVYVRNDALKPRQVFSNSDFELGSLENWRATGEAFLSQPTRGDNPRARGRGQRAGQQGTYWIGTFEKCPAGCAEPGAVQGDPPTGTLTSREFVVDGDWIFFRVGGGSDRRVVYVALVVEGVEVARTSGGRSESMIGAFWDARDHRGRRARIVIADESDGDWGHINADDFSYLEGQTELVAFWADVLSSSIRGAVECRGSVESSGREATPAASAG